MPAIISAGMARSYGFCVALQSSATAGKKGIN